MVDFVRKLPVECTDIIWSFLDQEQILLLARVCTHWKKSVEPVLYERVSLYSLLGIRRYVEMIMERPDLGERVRSLELSGVYDIGNKKYFPEEWIPAYEIICSLFQYVPRLQKLKLFTCIDLLAEVIRQVGVDCSELRSVEIYGVKVCAADIQALWYLPAIEKVRAVPGYLKYESSALSIPSRALKDLCLKSTYRNGNPLANMLRLSPALKKLAYSWVFTMEFEQKQDLERLTASLRQVKGTLEELVLATPIDEEEVWAAEIYESLIVGHLGSLHEFQKLRKLELPVTTLLGWFPEEAPSIEDILPGSLEHLCLSEDLVEISVYEWSEEALLQKLAAFFVLARNTHPRLVQFEFVHNGWDPRSLEKLEEMCVRAGVSFAHEKGLRLHLL